MGVIFADCGEDEKAFTYGRDELAVYRHRRGFHALDDGSNILASCRHVYEASELTFHGPVIVFFVELDRAGSGVWIRAASMVRRAMGCCVTDS